MGRAARNANSLAIMYADTITPQMQTAIDEVERRRKIQLEYNEKHGITPETITKAIRRGIEQELAAKRTAQEAVGGIKPETYSRNELLKLLEEMMMEAAEKLEFEDAAHIRDRIDHLKSLPEDSKPMPLDTAGGPRTKAGMSGSKAGKSKGKRGRPS